MAHHIVTLKTSTWPTGETVLRDGRIADLNERVRCGEVPPKAAGWNGPCSEAVPRKFYAGFGEGTPCDTWQEAVLLSLYDLFQVTEGIKDGDTFEATHPVTGETARYECRGFHVVMA